MWLIAGLGAVLRVQQEQRGRGCRFVDGTLELDGTISGSAHRRSPLFLPLTAFPADGVADRIRAILESSADSRQCFWGLQVADAESGEVLLSENEDKFFVPASNTKLFTTSLALRRLGPGYKFRTRIEADATPGAEGRIHQLRLIGGGDPNLSGRLVPYSKEESTGDPLEDAIKAMADEAVAKGVRVIDGDVVGDDSAYLWEPYPDGWALDDPVFEYGAPVSALTLNDNDCRLRQCLAQARAIRPACRWSHRSNISPFTTGREPSIPGRRNELRPYTGFAGTGRERDDSDVGSAREGTARD